jgi:PAS domain S-box-containing protein
MEGKATTGHDHRFLRIIQRFFDVDTVAIGVADSRGINYASVVGDPVPEAPPGASFGAWVLREQQPVTLPDAHANVPFGAQAKPNETGGVRFMAGVPLHPSDRNPKGVLLLFDAAPRTLSDDEMEALHEFAHRASMPTEAVPRSAGRRADGAINPDAVAAISNNIAEGIFRSVPGQGLVYVNQACVHMFGYESTEAMLEVPPEALYADPDRRGDVIHQLDAEGVYKRNEALFRRKDGSTFWGLVSGQATYDAEGHVVHRDGAVIDITERKRVEKKLQESEERWQRLVENHPEAVFISTEGQFRYANPAGAQLLGADAPHDVVGASLFQFVPEREIADNITARGQALARGEATPPFIHRIRRLDGEERIIEVNSVPITHEGKAAVQTVARDITERQHAEEQLRAAEAQFRGLVEQSLVGIYIIQDGRFVYANPALAESLGYATEALMGDVPVEDVVYDDDWPLVRDNLQKRYRGDIQEIKYSFRIRRLDGTLRTVEVHGARTEHDGEPAVIGTLLDVTDRMKHEQQLVAAKEQAEEMNRLKSAFLANMSHEIRTPLTSIIGFADLIASSPESAAEFAGLIQRSGERLLWTLNSVLDLAQLEAGALKLTTGRIDLHAEVREVMDQFRPQAQRKGIALRLDLPDDPVYGWVDRAAVARVTTNLVSNAVKFTDDGFVAATLRPDGDVVELRVTDTGIGIGADFLKKVFDEFRQESTGAGRTHEGSGLGLTITRRLVELMDGSITVESTPGEGTTFTVRLPRAQAGEGEQPRE